MPIYAYKAKDRAGNTRTGTLEANDERHAAEMIREAGGLPMDIRPTRGQSTSAHVPNVSPRPAIMRLLIDPIWTGVNIRMLVFFFRQLATLLGAGMSLSEALRSVASRSSGQMRRIITEAAVRVQNGGQLSDTIARYPRVFGTLPLCLIRAGETAGLLTPMVERIASNLEYELTIRRRLMKVLFYPFVIFFFIVVMPHVKTLFLGSPGAFFEELWGSVRVWLPHVIIVVIVLKLVMQFEPCRLAWDAIKMLPPVLGTMARKVAMSRFCRAISDLYAAGMPAAEAVRVSADACANVAVGRGLKRALPSIRAGEGLTLALAKTGALMPIVVDMLATGEKVGSLDSVLPKVAEYMDEEVDATIHKTGITLFVVVILVAAWIVLNIARDFYMGQINDQFRRADQ